jgi:hypothetical protein
MSIPALRTWGFVLTALSVVLPALPFGALFAQPPMPLAVLWAAYGWAAEDESGWRAPIALTLLGLVHDQLAYGPYGLFVVLYLSAYLIGRVVAVNMSAPNLVSLWGGFIITALLTIAIVAIVARFMTPIAVLPYAEAALITALLFPLVRPLYMSASATARPGARR